jgi:hypothetical protein
MKACDIVEEKKGRGPCQDPPEVVLVVLPQSTTWFTPHLQDNHVDLHSIGATVHSSITSSTTTFLPLNSSRWQPDHHNSLLQLGTHATTVGKLGILPRIVASRDRATHRALQYLWWANREV